MGKEKADISRRLEVGVTVGVGRPTHNSLPRRCVCHCRPSVVSTHQVSFLSSTCPPPYCLLRSDTAHETHAMSSSSVDRWAGVVRVYTKADVVSPALAHACQGVGTWTHQRARHRHVKSLIYPRQLRAPTTPPTRPTHVTCVPVCLPHVLCATPTGSPQRIRQDRVHPSAARC